MVRVEQVAQWERTRGGFGRGYRMDLRYESAGQGYNQPKSPGAVQRGCPRAPGERKQSPIHVLRSRVNRVRPGHVVLPERQRQDGFRQVLAPHFRRGESLPCAWQRPSTSRPTSSSGWSWGPPRPSSLTRSVSKLLPVFLWAIRTALQNKVRQP